MSSPVVTVPPDMRLKDVADLLVRHGISAVPVVDDGELVGIVSEADLVPLELAPDPRAHLAPPAQPPGGLPGMAGEAMTRAVVALPEDADTAEAGRLMLERRIRSIPVVRGRRVVGIVARRDLLEVLARSDGDIAGELEALLAADWARPAPTGRRSATGSWNSPAPPTRPAAGWPPCWPVVSPGSSRSGSARSDE